MDSANAKASSRPSSSEQDTNEGLLKAVDRFLASSYIPFAELSVGVDRPVKAMVVRKWDSITLLLPALKGCYGANFICLVRQGGAIHCVARANISHCFTDKLLVGEVYSIANFIVAPPRPAFRIRNADPLVLHLEGNSIVKHLQCSPEGFNKYPLQLVPIPEVVDNGSRYLIAGAFSPNLHANTVANTIPAAGNNGDGLEAVNLNCTPLDSAADTAITMSTGGEGGETTPGEDGGAGTSRTSNDGARRASHRPQVTGPQCDSAREDGGEPGTGKEAKL